MHFPQQLIVLSLQRQPGIELPQEVLTAALRGFLDPDGPCIIGPGLPHHIPDLCDEILLLLGLFDLPDLFLDVLDQTLVVLIATLHVNQTVIDYVQSFLFTAFNVYLFEQF